MSINHYQRIVNNLDKEIAYLEKKKANSDENAVAAQKREANIIISKNESSLSTNSKLRQKEIHRNRYIRASKESVDILKKISDKRMKRNNAYLRLQKEEQNEKKKQERENERVKALYETKISEMQKQLTPKFISTSSYDESNEEYDVFISHAWEDKELFVDEFVTQLISKGAKVWYDKDKIKWGDTMRTKIDKGLRNSKFGVIILSPDYIAEHKYWTKAELDGLFQMESISGKTILPVWHNLTKQQVIDYSPIIASRLALSTAIMTTEEIAEKLIELLPNE